VSAARLLIPILLNFSWLSGWPSLLGAGELIILDPPQVALVTTDQAPVMAGDELIARAARGDTVTLIRANDNWRYSPQLKGWVHLRDLLPLDRAVPVLSEQIAREPTAVAYQLRGIARMNLQEWGPAAQDFEQAYDLGESAPNLHHNLAVCYERLGKPEAALEEYDSILNAFPDEFPSRMGRGNLLLRQGQVQAALRDLSEAVALNPQSADAYNSMGIALRSLHRYPEAIDAYSEALKRDARRADALGNRGYCQKQLGNSHDALNDFEAALELSPRSLSLRNDLAWLLATSPVDSVRNSNRAVALAEAICAETENQNGDFLDTLAAAYASAGRFSAAEEAVKLAIQKFGTSREANAARERLQSYQNKTAFIEKPAAVPPAASPADAPADTSAGVASPAGAAPEMPDPATSDIPKTSGTEKSADSEKTQADPGQNSSTEKPAGASE